jgi:amidophosphoribosyltransferase
LRAWGSFLKEKAVFAIYGHQDAARLTFYGLYALQHRGQQSAGIVVSSGQEFIAKSGLGLVSEVFSEDDFQRLQGRMACGQLGYATVGREDIQPFCIHYDNQPFALAVSGGILNAEALRRRLEDEGSIFQTNGEAELIMHLLVRNIHQGLEQGLISALAQLQGAYCLLLMTKDTLVAARDPRGFRPLCLGQMQDSYVLAAETCALDLMDAVYIREVEAGEILFIDNNGPRSLKPFPALKHAHCMFELIYFARPDSQVFQQNVYLARKRQGAVLAQENPDIKAEFVMSFPDSGTYSALGYSQASAIPFEMGIIRNHYVGRTFIQPSRDIRNFQVKIKLNPVRELVKGRDIIVMDDSIVHGTTIRARVKSLRAVGAARIKALIASPPYRYPCRYGVDFSTRGELIASTHSIEETMRLLDLDDLRYLSIPGLLRSMEAQKDSGFCLSCFDNNYPVLPSAEEE